MKPGIYENLMDGEYHATEACSSSWLKTAHRKSAAHAEAPFAPSPQMRLGTIVHALVLEQRTAYTIAPDVNSATKAGKTAMLDWASQWGEPPEDTKKADLIEWVETASGLLVVDNSTAVDAAMMSNAVLAHPEAYALLQGGKSELSAFAEIKGHLCKARIDYRQHQNNIELKTTKDASYGGFQRQFANLGYHLSIAWYQIVLEELGEATNESYVIAVENTPPYGVAVYEIPETAVEIGRHHCWSAYEKWIERQEMHETPGYPSEIQVLDLPAWAK